MTLPGSVWTRGQCQGSNALTVKLGSLGQTGQKCSGELGVGFGERDSQKKTEAVVRKESADTQEYQSCQQNDMDVDENMEELSSIPGAVSSAA